MKASDRGRNVILRKLIWLCFDEAETSAEKLRDAPYYLEIFLSLIYYNSL